MRHRRQDVWRRHCRLGDIQITRILVKHWINTLQPLLNPLEMLRIKYKILPRTNSLVGIAHRYGLEGPRIESRWAEARFSSFVQTGCGAHPASYKMSTGPFLVLKGPGRGVNHLPQSSDEVKVRVELYIYSSFVLSWYDIGWNLNFYCPERKAFRFIVPVIAFTLVLCTEAGSIWRMNSPYSAPRPALNGLTTKWERITSAWTLVIRYRIPAVTLSHSDRTCDLILLA